GQHLALLAVRIVTGRTVDSGHAAVRKSLGIKSRRFFGRAVVPEANHVSGHPALSSSVCCCIHLYDERVTEKSTAGSARLAAAQALHTRSRRGRPEGRTSRYGGARARRRARSCNSHAEARARGTLT